MIPSHTMLSLTSLALWGATALAAAPVCQPNTWVNLAPLPSTRQEHSTVAINSTTIAIVGGVVQLGKSINTTDLMQFYDIPSNNWSTVAPLPYKVNHPNVAVVNETLYLLGGLIDGPSIPGQFVNWVASGECHKYDSATNEWSSLPSMPSGTERGSAVPGVYNEMIYLAGGMTVLNDYEDSVTAVTAFNTTSEQWQRLPPAAANIPGGRQHATGAVVNDTFYVVGGRWFSQLNTRGAVFELDLTNQERGWSTSPILMPVPRGGISGAAFNGSIYTFGGEGNPGSNTGVFNQSEAYNTAAQNWTDLVPMAVPRHGTYAAAVGNMIYIPGGGLQQDGKSVNWNGTVRLDYQTAHFDAYCA